MSVPAGQVAAAILLPPLGVYLARGPGTLFLIACGLTMLGFVPGAIFALCCLFAPLDRRAPA